MNLPNRIVSTKRRGSGKEGVNIDATRKMRAYRAAKNTSRQRETMVKGRREIFCPAADALYDRYGEAKENGTVAAWRAELIKAYQGCKYGSFEICDPDEVGDLATILGELKVEEVKEENKMKVGGGKMVGGNNPINHLFKLNSWLATHET